jgi:tRNA G10  N-methylase Trm11
MEPYYQDDSCTIYHADCRDVLPELPKVDLVLTDPPYGIGYVMKERITGKGNRRVKMKGHAPIVGDDRPFNPSHLLELGECILFGGNYFYDKLPPNGGWFVWDKTGGGRGPDDNFSDVEMAWISFEKKMHLFRHLWKGLTRDSEAGEHVVHPTQKPIFMMKYIIQKWTIADEMILDPYMGSGPTLRAAKDLGRKAIGIEIEEKYCEIAAKRLAQEVLPL